MTQSLQLSDVFVAALDAARFQDLETSGVTPLVREKRKAAFAAYRALPMPTVRDEEWRRTDPDQFRIADFQWLPVLASKTAPVGEHDFDASFDVVVSVNEDGYHIADRSGLLAAGKVVVCDLETAARDHASLVAAHVQGAALIEGDRKFTAMNGAFWNFALFIHVPRKVEIPNGILVRYQLGRAGSLLVPKLVVVADEGSSVKVVEMYESGDDAPALCIGVRELYVEQAARLQLFALQEWGRTSFHIGEDWSRVGRDAQIDWVTLTLGSQASKMTMGCDVSAPNSNAYLSGLFFADRDQHVDQRTLQQHSAPNTYSNLLYKGAVKDKGHSVYQGIIGASPGAIKVDAYQMNNNLVLNNGAKADSLPGLKIDADDLKCSHGSTMGNLDPDQLFYLKSRGLSEVEARRMLVLAFFEEVITKIPYAFLQDRVREDVNRKI
ncbi:MAG TPA: Fe-S cluster assembly protein SufD [Kiritimatiellia bacterium]|nr:Fe-S cluster assembly protein SufD [Kiritimatiellia bacterium]HMP35726.1 Fe-S cluster assembly protein SufD [Kiritimatiellia bacterium]